MRVFLLPAAALLASSLSLTAQGPLTPPGGPAPTMKTLEQAEPRRPISSLPFTIEAEGSYYLTGNLQPPANGNGITVGASNVVIDLNGFSLIGNGGSTNAITVNADRPNVTVRNGTLRNWGGTAYRGNFNRNLRAHDLHVAASGAGIGLGAAALVTDCVAEGNAGTGISTANDSIVERCVSRGNTGGQGNGIFVGSRSIVRRCVTNGNSQRGIVANLSHISECESTENGASGIVNGGTGFQGDGGVVQSCHSTANGAAGITTGIRALVRDCVVSGSGGVGIAVLGDSVVLSNRSSDNGKDGAAAGIDSTGGSGSRIEANHVRDNNGTGIKGGGSDVIIRNTAGNNRTNGNLTNYFPSSGFNFGPVETAATSTHHTANFEF